jgi:WD40 repeat protein
MRRLILLSLAWLAAIVSVANGQDSISPETLSAIKSATVYVKVPLGDRLATGSGWVMKVDGDKVYIVTNHHVIADAPRAADHERAATVVFHSGTKREQSVRAEILASQRNPDLAVLRVTGLKDPPAPIDFARPPELAETMPVVVFGFPFTGLDRGKNPPITVTRGSVSSVRSDEIVQLDTNLNPGNSGGPIVDVKGHLVGIAFARPRAKDRDTEPIAGIGLAIPAAALTRMANGLVASCVPRVKEVKDGSAEVEVEVRLIDPLGQVKKITLFYTQSDDLPEGKAVRDMPGVQQIEFPAERQQAKGVITIKAPKSGVFLYYCQASGLNGAAKPILGDPQAFHVNFKRLVTENEAVAKKGTLVALERRTDSGLKCLAFSPNGKMAATGDARGQVQLWDMDTGWKMETLKVSKKSADYPGTHSVAFSPDGKLLAAAVNIVNTDLHVLVVWEVAGRKEALRIEDNEEHGKWESIVFSPDGKTIAVGGLHNKVKLWETATGKLRARMKAPNQYSNEYTNALAFSPDGSQLATAGDVGGVRLWDMATLKEIAALRGENGLSAKSVAWSPDGKTLAVGYENGVAALWNVPGRKLRTVLNTDDRHDVRGVAFNSDGTLLVTCGGIQGHEVNLWQVASGKRLVALKTDVLSGSVAFSPDDQYVAATRSYGNAGYLMVWNLAVALAQQPEKK